MRCSAGVLSLLLTILSAALPLQAGTSASHSQSGGSAKPTTPAPSSQPTPSPSPGFSNLAITESSSEITWSSGWSVQVSSCDETDQSKLTSAADQWFTFVTSPNSSPYVYLDMVARRASFSVYINGEEQDINTSSMLNCSFDQLGPLIAGNYTNNVTIYVHGPLMSSSDVGSSNVNWSFEFNKFIIAEQSSGSTSAAAGDSKPQIVVILASVLLAAAFWA
ncbi:hypothetical protein AX14_001425 [Amanita brunnescens Koide BX004]|nr:hypothetical protein AX14_001425 [Amanita brunnescens Koide BX004]